MTSSPVDIQPSANSIDNNNNNESPLSSPVDETVQDLRQLFEASLLTTTMTTKLEFDSDVKAVMVVMNMPLTTDVAEVLLDDGWSVWKSFHHFNPADATALQKDDSNGRRVPCMLCFRRILERFILFRDHK